MCFLRWLIVGLIMLSYSVSRAEQPEFISLLESYRNCFESFILNNKQEAFSCFEAGLRSNPTNWPVLYNSAVILVEQGKFEAAYERFLKVYELKPDFPAARLGMAFCKAKLGDFEKSIDILQRANKWGEKKLDAQYNKALAYAELKKFQEALESFEQALKIQRDHFFSLLGKGLTLLKLGMTSQAREVCLAAEAFWPEYPEVLKCLGLAEAKMGNHANAQAYFDSAFSVEPSATNLVNLLVHLLKRNEREKILALLDKHKGLLRTAESNYKAALILISVGDLSNSIPYLVAASDKDLSESHLVLGKVLKDLSDELQSKKYYEKYLKNRPHCKGDIADSSKTSAFISKAQTKPAYTQKNGCGIIPLDYDVNWSLPFSTNWLRENDSYGLDVFDNEPVRP